MGYTNKPLGKQYHKPEGVQSVGQVLVAYFFGDVSGSITKEDWGGLSVDGGTVF